MMCDEDGSSNFAQGLPSHLDGSFQSRSLRNRGKLVGLWTKGETQDVESLGGLEMQ